METRPEFSNAISATAKAGLPWFHRLSNPILFLIVSLALVGGYLAFTIPVSVFPSTDFPRILIGVDNGVMPIDQMLVTITRPLEEAVNSVPGLQKVTSITSRGSAEVDLFFEWNSDMILTLQRVDAVVARLQAELPPTAKVETHRMTFAVFPIIGYSLTSDTVPPNKLWEIATYDLKPRINRLDGVATVIIQGGRVPEFQVTPDPARLLTAGITVPDILDAIRRTNLVDSPGLIEHDHQLVLGLVSGQVRTPEQIAQIVVKNSPAGVPIRLGDISSIAPSVAPTYTMVTADGKPAVLLNVNRQPESNTLAVANEVHALIQELAPTLPSGVHLEPFYDQSTIVHDSISSVRDAVLLGIVLSSIILVLFLRDWGTSFVAGLVIPVTLLITFIVLKATNQSFNLMTLGGLAAAVGLVIDDAIVVLENIVLHRDAGQTRLQAIQGALKELTVPLIGSTITPIVVFLPLISTTGVTGTFFRALAVTMTVSLLTSLLLALSWTPTLSQYLVRRKDKETVSAAAPSEGPNMAALLAAEEAHLSGFFGRIVGFYTRAMQAIVKRPWMLAGSSVGIIILSYVCYSLVGTDFLPEMDEGGFILDYYTPPGSSLAESNRILLHIEDILHSTPEVENTSRRTGMQLGLAAVTEANNGDFTVKLKKDRQRGIDDVIEDVRSEIKHTEPAADIEFVQLLQDMIGDLTSQPEPIVIRLFSQDGKLLNDTAPRVADAIGKIQIGKSRPVVDVLDGVENTISGPAVTFQVNPTVAARAGFTLEEVAVDASAVLEGEPAATPVVLNDRAYTIRVRFPDENRSSLDRMTNTLLTSASGHTATLGSLATVTSDPGETEIRRENLQRLVQVTARLEGVDMGTGVAAVQKAVRDMHLPSSIRIQYGGLYEEDRKSSRDLMMVLLLALLLLFAVLLFEFRTFSAPTAILTSALLSTFGGFLALLLTSTTFNVASRMGMIMVIGIVAKNGILLLDAEHRFRDLGFSPKEAMIQAGRRRLRPIAMTALATVAGMLPLAFGIGAGSEMLKPLAIVVIGGLLSSMVLSLVFTPAIHFYLRPRKTAAA
ncbi:MAG: AcrB/AcrD/AcrF family protein [Acidobacteria bacterium]|nr:MAG: AcrB/AcrD/AcrF family protein [Acidobacteriota bacterium]PYT87808.1 MAG: AcrB/AcrD/AcrF family protein [Acidobacteriota bacterium]